MQFTDNEVLIDNFFVNSTSMLSPGGGELAIEGDWDDEDDEDFDDRLDAENDLREIKVRDNVYEPDPEDDDHLPDDDLQ
jgi:hypothetical protein